MVVSVKYRKDPKINLNKLLNYDVSDSDKDDFYRKYVEINKYVVDASKVSEFNECIFRKVSFSGEIGKIDFIDVIFENCDFCNCSFDNHSFFRVIFNNCRLVGCNFINFTINDCLFNNCNLMYSNFSDCKFKSNDIVDCNLTDCCFHLIKFNNTNFVNSILDKAEFTESNLKNIDFSTCDINGIKLDSRYLKGLVISSYQAALLIGILGVNVKN